MMKHPFLILIFAFSLNACKAQKITIQNTKIMIPKIDNTFETFDIESFHEGNGSRQDKKVNETYIIKTGDWKNTKIKSGYGEAIYFNNSYFFIGRIYFPNGNIELKSLRFNNGSEYGIRYEFDEKGNLVEEINTDEGYDFGWEQVIKYCEDNKIALTKGYKKGGYQTSIYKETNEDGKKVWHIDYLAVKNNTGWMTQVYLNGKTGKVLEKKEAEFEGN